MKNNPRVTDIEVDVHAEEVYMKKKVGNEIQTYQGQVNEDGMFLINWEGKNSYIIEIRGLDEDGNILYQDKLN
ncbi:hypothetical protein MUN88_16715 [Gracilibacillus caseinilyticus]|uniref:Uncharacterized protein n=1 Tax=Gracilibacillus caseinilyticus TaxID=2932256 RepID=A0ABY4ETC9_9BACI|nr:hypothetical protein [Gracilibacillus caseinilyticus]UOQ47679.1 hypothetical protein MUN88_16715 [Gracilibacillus caseinilyticus]